MAPTAPAQLTITARFGPANARAGMCGHCSADIAVHLSQGTVQSSMSPSAADVAIPLPLTSTGSMNSALSKYSFACVMDRVDTAVGDVHRTLHAGGLRVGVNDFTVIGNP
jgi:hypothetical protein